MKRDSLPLPVSPALGSIGEFAPWQLALPALTAVLAVIAACYATTFVAMIDTWARSETFTHGFVVAPISVWLIVRMRDRLRALTPRPSWMPLPFFALAGAGWLLGQLGGVNALSQAAAVSMLVLAVPAVLGLDVARAMMFPLGFLFFAVPAGDFLLPVLMEWTADFTVAALRATGVPVYRDGLLLVLPTGRWSIIEACSGVRYLIASLMAGTLFAYLNYRATWRRLAFVGVSIAVPVVANWLRAYMIVMLGHVSNNRIATGVDHVIYGWVFFGFVMLVMFWIGSRWHEPAIAQPATFPRLSTTVPAKRALFWLAALAAIVLSGAWPLLERVTMRDAPGASVALEAVIVDGWQSTAVDDEDWSPHFEEPSGVLHQRLLKGDTRAGLYIAYYVAQTLERKLVSSANVLARSEDRKWLKIGSSTRAVRIGDSEQRIVEARIRGRADRTYTVWQWYWINGTLTSSDVYAKALTAWLRLIGRGDNSAVVVLYVEDADPRAATLQLQALARDAWPRIAASLDHAGHSQ